MWDIGHLIGVIGVLVGFTSRGRITYRKVVRIPTFSPFTQRCLFGKLDSSMAVDERSHASVTWSR